MSRKSLITGLVIERNGRITNKSFKTRTFFSHRTLLNQFEGTGLKFLESVLPESHLVWGLVVLLLFNLKVIRKFF